MAIEILVNVNLAKYTTFQIGGDADSFCKVKTKDELIEALNWAKEREVNFKVIGGGSNLLISDKGFRGLVILNRMGEYSIKDERVVADSGCNLSKIARETVGRSLRGLDFATGIPGTIGGAAAGNAGAYGKSMSDIVLAAEVWDNGKVREYLNDDFEYDYRFSRLKNDGNRVILSVTVKLERGDIEEMKEASNLDIGKRIKDYAGANAGSYFCNIPVSDLSEEQIDKLNKFIIHDKVAVGKMIHDLGLKGLKVGNAIVSENHANVISNMGGATAADVLELERVISERVLSAYGIILRTEVTKIGEL